MARTSPDKAKPAARRRKAPAKAPAKARAPRRAPASARKAPVRKAPPRKAPPRKPAAASVGRERRFRPLRGEKRLLLLALVAVAVALCLDVIVLQQRVTERMEGRVHDEPARITGVQARLAPGEVATEAGWRQTWGLLGLSEVDAVQEPGQFSLVRNRWTVHPHGGVPLAIEVANRRVVSVKRVADGAPVPAWDFELPAVALLTGEDRERRSVVPLTDIPNALQRAVVAIEDERFYRHAGIDPRGILRAAWTNLRGGGLRQGGSTLTQQLAKNMFLTSDRTLARKGQEALLALILERRYDKDRILEAYLNEIYLGQRDGFAIMGVSEAARRWFGKDVAALDTSEAALLAGAIHSPNRSVPWKHPEEAKRRRDQVLNKMLELKALPEPALLAALEQPVVVVDSPRLRRQAAWFVDGVVGTLGERYSTEALHRDGLEVVSTLDARMQRAAEQAIADGMAALKRDHPKLFEGTPPEAALVAMDPKTGAVRAFVGGTDYGRSQFDRVRSARRQPGSAFKPIVLAAAIGDRWPHLGPGTLVLDTPVRVPGAGARGADWTPRNYDGKALGPITLRRATEQSRNLPFVHLGLKVGPERIRQTAKSLGIASELAAVPSLAIGSQEVTPLDLAVAYSAFAGGGHRPEAQLLTGVRDRTGDWLERSLPARKPAIDPRVAAVVTDLLQGVIERGTARSVRKAGFRLPAAGKTGTSNDGRDAWMVGYTPDLVMVVWVGFDEGRTLGLSSVSTAVPIWSRFAVAVQPLLSGDSFPRAPAIGPPIAARPTREELVDEDRERRREEQAAARAMGRR